MSRRHRPTGRRPRQDRESAVGRGSTRKRPPISPVTHPQPAVGHSRSPLSPRLAATFDCLRAWRQRARHAADRVLERCSARTAADSVAELYVAVVGGMAAGMATTQAWMERLRSQAATSGHHAANLLFPPTCLVCDLPWSDGDDRGHHERNAERLICGECRAAFGYRAERVCERCAAPLPRYTDPRHCPECRRRKLPFRAAIALGEYRGSLRDAVLRTKRAAYESLTIQLGEVLADRLEPLGWKQQCDVVIPLPSHWWRRWTRGTSGPELLAERLADRLSLPCRTRWLSCQRRTRKQGMLLPAERAENVRGAFTVRQPDAVRGQRILLVDDVMTTGATLKEAATALLRARASSVFVAVLARGTGD